MTHPMTRDLAIEELGDSIDTTQPQTKTATGFSAAEIGIEGMLPRMIRQTRPAVSDVNQQSLRLTDQ